MTVENPSPSSDKAAARKARDRDLSKFLDLPKWQGPPLTVKEMQVAIETAVVESYWRSVGAKPPRDDEA